MLLENLRFHREEKANDPDFARALAEYGEIYINDAFARFPPQARFGLQHLQFF